jgi:hypothetical protein
MAMASPSSSTAPAISDAQRIEIARGAERERRFAFARKLASFNGVGVGIFAGVSLLSAVVDVSSLLLAFPLAIIAFVELNGGQRVARYERNGLVQLACNELALVALVSVYALTQILSAQNSASPLGEIMAQGGVPTADLGIPDMSSELGNFDELYRSAVTAFYGVLIVVTAVIQGGCAFYYYSRLKHLDRFLAETPRWVIDHLRTSGR